MKDHFAMFAAYNGWANSELYAAAQALSPEEFARDVGVFFRSMLGTLNHILVADRIWMKRFTGEGEHPDRLDAILHEDFDALKLARIAEDLRMTEWIEGLDEAALQAEFSFRTITNPTDITQRLGPAIAHLFNHQTHHRGQAHTVLSLLGKSPPPLDLVLFYRSGIGKAYA